MLIVNNSFDNDKNIFNVPMVDVTIESRHAFNFKTLENVSDHCLWSCIFPTDRTCVSGNASCCDKQDELIFIKEFFSPWVFTILHYIYSVGLQCCERPIVVAG